jgi:hypothetical protein
LPAKYSREMPFFYKEERLGSNPRAGTMKNLCICQYAHSRSVALARLLQQKGQVAVAIGVGTSGDAIKVLAPWADRIFVLQEQYKEFVPAEYHDKVIVMDVGPDKWSNPYSQELAALLETKYNEL